MKNCETCRHWRFKGSDESGKSFGICECPEWGVSMMSEETIVEYFVQNIRISREIANSVRTAGNFGCNQYGQYEKNNKL